MEARRTTPERIRRYRFFREHGGSIVGRNAEIALRMARTEELLERAQELGVASVQWPYDDEPYDPGDAATDEEARAKFESNEWTGPFGCIVTAGDAETSLWGIVFGPRELGDPYARVVACDLAYELEDDLRQAIGDHLDATREIAL